MSKYDQSSVFALDEQNAEVAAELQQAAKARSAVHVNRRGFLGVLGVTAGMATLAGCSSDSSSGNNPAPPPTPPAGPSVVDVLNFALNLEYFEASFYSYATTGNGLPATLVGSNPGTVTGGAKVPFANPLVASIAAEIAADEQAHVNFLRTLITQSGGTPVDLPALDLTGGGKYVVTMDAQFIALARGLEATGVGAYEGAAGYLTSTPAGLTYAAAIHEVESQHESVFRQLCIQLNVMSPAVDSVDLPPTGTQVFNTEASTGLYSAPRSPSQVLQIVYGGAATGASSGGFFPQGMNGNIKTI